jgi:hypothetical protein
MLSWFTLQTMSANACKVEHGELHPCLRGSHRGAEYASIDLAKQR